MRECPRAKLLAGMLLAAVHLLAAGAGPAAAETLIHLAPCEVPGRESPGRCGTFTVFENRAAGAGRQIDLHVIILPATSGDPARDPIFVLAGGPGQGATLLAPAIDQILPASVLRRRDVVLIDQRGTGHSSGLRCDPEGLPGLLAALVFRFPAPRLRECRASFDADLSLYNTPIAMDDLDDVRAALGYERINLWGGSYGTRAALVYMRRHGEHVRAAILRGAVPTDSTLPLHFARDAEDSLHLLLEACAAADDCRARYPASREHLQLVVDRLARAPARVRTVDPTTLQEVDVEMTAGAFAGGIRLMQYGTPFSRDIPWVIDSAWKGNLEPFLGATLPLAVQILQQVSLGAFLSVVCTEDIPYLDDGEAGAGAKGTYLGGTAVENLVAACRDWPRGRLPAGYRLPVKTDIPVLVISGQEDPVTGPRWGEAVLRHMPRGVHLVLPRTGHLPPAPGCTGAIVSRFIEAGSGKDLDLSCAAGIERPPFRTGSAAVPAPAPRASR